MEDKQPDIIQKDTGVPPGRFYTVIIIVALVVGTMMYFVGEKKGATDIRLEYQEVIIEEQGKENEIYKKHQCSDVDECFNNLLHK